MSIVNIGKRLNSTKSKIIKANDIKRYSSRYDKRVPGKPDELIEEKLREWFKNHRYLDNKNWAILRP